MATSQKGSSNKKNTNSRPAAKKSGGSRTSAPRGTSGAKKTAQRTAKTAKNSAAASNGKQIGAIVLFAVALFLLFVTIIPGAGAWLVLQRVVFGLFGGVMAFVLPVLLLIVAIMTSYDRDTINLKHKVIEACLIIVLICAAIYVIAGDGSAGTFGDAVAGAFKLGKDPQNGGAIGAIVGAPLLLLFGNAKAPAAITLILVAFVVLMLMTGTTLAKFVQKLYDPVKSAGEATRENYESIQAAREERRAQRIEEQEEKQARREIFNPDVDLGPTPGRRRRAKAAAEEAPVEEAISFQKSRGRKKAPLESELAETAASAAAAAAAAKAAKEAAPAFDDNGVAVGDSLDEIVKKAAGKTSKQSRPKSEPIVEEKFDVEAARNQMAEMEKAAGEAEKPKKQYQLPPLDCLNPPKLSLGGGSEAELRD
ncbi:MAG: hypothetical protein IIV27_08625, partial [Clostridia bacterium]|nr:hypothetical protein [Clostridia bacterium]